LSYHQFGIGADFYGCPAHFLSFLRARQSGLCIGHIVGGNPDALGDRLQHGARSSLMVGADGRRTGVAFGQTSVLMINFIVFQARKIIRPQLLQRTTPPPLARCRSVLGRVMRHP